MRRSAFSAPLDDLLCRKRKCTLALVGKQVHLHSQLYFMTLTIYPVTRLLGQ